MRFPESGFTMCGFSAIEAFLAPHARYVPSYRLTSRRFGGANAAKVVCSALLMYAAEAGVLRNMSRWYVSSGFLHAYC